MNLSGLLLEIKELSEEQFENFRKSIDTIREESPCDSDIYGLIRKTKQGYIGALKIISCHGVFKASTRNHNLQKAFSTLVERVKAQLDQWKRERVFEFSEAPKRVSALSARKS